MKNDKTSNKLSRLWCRIIFWINVKFRRWSHCGTCGTKLVSFRELEELYEANFYKSFLEGWFITHVCPELHELRVQRGTTERASANLLKQKDNVFTPITEPQISLRDRIEVLEQKIEKIIKENQL